MAMDAVQQASKVERGSDDQVDPKSKAVATDKSADVGTVARVDDQSRLSPAIEIWQQQQNGMPPRDPESSKIRENIKQSLSELTLVNGPHLATKADSYVYGAGFKSVLATLDYDQLQALKQKYEQKTGEKLDITTLDKIKDFSPVDEHRMQRYQEWQSDPDKAMRLTASGQGDVVAKLHRKEQVEHEREQLALMLNPSRTAQEDHALATIGIHKSRPDLVTAALKSSPEIQREVQIENITAAVRHAADHSHFGVRWPDTDGVQAILESLPPSTVKDIEESSRRLTGKALSDEVREHLNNGLTGAMFGGGQYEMVSRYFERTGPSDESGQIRAAMESLERSYMGKVRRMHGPTERAEMDILKTVSVMSGDEVNRVQKELSDGKGQSLTDLTHHPRLSKAAQESLAVLLQADTKGRGADQINALVDIAQREKRLDILKLALRIAPDEVRKEIKDKRQVSLIESFTEDAVFKDYYRKNVVDYLTEGRMSLSTLIAGNTKPIYELSNTKEITRLVEHASSEERQRYLTDATYKKEVDTALDRASKNWFGYDAAIWKAKLKDQEGLTTALLPLGTPEILGKRPARADWARVLDEKFGPSEYKLFREHPEELARFEKDLNIVYAREDRLELMGRLKEKLGYRDVAPTPVEKPTLMDRIFTHDSTKAPVDKPSLLQVDTAKLTGSRSEILSKLKLADTTDATTGDSTKDFEDAQNRGRRSLSEMLGDARDPQEKARAFYTISPTELDAIQSDKAGARAAALDAISKYTPAKSSERYLAELAYKRMTSGDNASFDPMETVALAAIIPNKPIISLRAIELAMANNPGVMTTANPDSETRIKRQLIDTAFGEALRSAGIHDQYDEVGNKLTDAKKEYNELYTTGRLSLSHRLDLVSGMEAKRDILINDATDAEKTILRKLAPNREEAKLQQKALGYGEQKQLSLTVMQQGGTSIADMARAFYVGNKETWAGQKLDGLTSPHAEKLLKTLQEMPRENAAKIATEYFVKYGSVMSQDLLARVSPSERLTMRMALSNFELPANQVAMMARQERDGSNGARPFDWMTTFLDYSGPGAKESNDALISMLAHKQELLAQHDPAVAKEFESTIKSYLQAEENHGDTKRLLWALAAPIQAGGWTGLAYLAGKNLPWAAAVIGSKLMGKAQAVATLAIDRNILGPKQFTVMDGTLDVVALPFASIKATYYQLGKRAVSEYAAKTALGTGAHLALETGTSAAAISAASIILSSTP